MHCPLDVSLNWKIKHRRRRVDGLTLMWDLGLGDIFATKPAVLNRLMIHLEVKVIFLLMSDRAKICCKSKLEPSDTHRYPLSSSVLLPCLPLMTLSRECRDGYASVAGSPIHPAVGLHLARLQVHHLSGEALGPQLSGCIQPPPPEGCRHCARVWSVIPQPFPPAQPASTNVLMDLGGPRLSESSGPSRLSISICLVDFGLIRSINPVNILNFKMHLFPCYNTPTLSKDNLYTYRLTRLAATSKGRRQLERRRAVNAQLTPRPRGRGHSVYFVCIRSPTFLCNRAMHGAPRHDAINMCICHLQSCVHTWMLRQLLGPTDHPKSVNGSDWQHQLDPSTMYYEYPPAASGVPSGSATGLEYSYHVGGSATSVIQHPANMGQNYPAPSYASCGMPANAYGIPAPVNTTTDLYSSTYAMLSSDNCQNDWGYAATIEKPQILSNGATMEGYPMTDYGQPMAYSTANGYLPPPGGNFLQYGTPGQAYQGGYYEQPLPSTSAEGQSRPSTADLPANNSIIDPNDHSRVMCIGCSGVYISRRSLAAHLGQNEACRDAISRKYAESGSPEGDSGLNPICPNCDRYISQYRGNIRRHINQCHKRPSKGPSPASINNLSQHYASLAPIVPPESSAYHQVAPDSDIETGYILQPAVEPKPGAPITSSSKKSGKPSSVAVTASNPYVCAWCAFKTVYKGNMKRHLISVHACTDEGLRKISFDLERLRLLSAFRPVTPLATPPERIRGLGSRRRRPKAEKNDAPKRTKLLAEDEIPPAAVSDVVASFASPSLSRLSDESIATVASHDSGISSTASPN
uniref:C2H2-type domain-containing protein n=1 Tax=Panagrellus redivivus TaxID=6233 RepID=A0A7E4V2V3_PANRE